MANWCWGEWGFKFTIIRKQVKKLSFLNPKKVDSLYYDIESKCCNPHDDRFEKGGGIIDFYNANMIFIEDLLKLLHWTTILSRIIVFFAVFFWLNTIWAKYFNWTCVIKRK